MPNREPAGRLAETMKDNAVCQAGGAAYRSGVTIGVPVEFVGRSTNAWVRLAQGLGGACAAKSRCSNEARTCRVRARVTKGGRRCVCDCWPGRSWSAQAWVWPQRRAVTTTKVAVRAKSWDPAAIASVPPGNRPGAPLILRVTRARASAVAFASDGARVGAPRSTLDAPMRRAEQR